MNLEYKKYLESKQKTLSDTGFEAVNLPEMLFDFQKFCVNRALKKGRYALFEDCGLGKTFQQIAWANEVANYTGKPVLILAPLVVVNQTIQEANKIGIGITEYCDETIINNGIFITNYEQLEHVNPFCFSGIVLDESSILKSFDGVYRNLLIDYFRDIPFKLCCTATPSPNDPMELGNHAEFLGAMSYKEMLAMYFVHDGGETAKWRLKGHAIKDFWRFVGSWSIMLSKPSDIGFSDDGYNLPPLELIEKKIVTPKRDNGQLFNHVAISATNFNEELRITQIQRLDQVAEIVNNSDESFIIWVKQNTEGDELRKLIQGAIEVKGSDTPEYKKDKMLAFANNKFRVLITKVKIAGFGMNFQNCHNMIFASPDFSYEGIYQALRRELRFGQKHTVNAWLITTDTMENVIGSFRRKQQQDEEMRVNMQLALNEVFNKETKQIQQLKPIQLPSFLKQAS